MKQQDILQLVERFLDAETTLDEEQYLYEFFTQDEVPTELQPYRKIFGDLACLKKEREYDDFHFFNEEKKFVMMSDSILRKPKLQRWKFYGVAASVAVFFACGIFAYKRLNDRDFAIAYVNDKIIADDDTALKMGTDVMCEIFDNSGKAEECLYEIFNPEEE